jgi:hypothetical protein
MRKSCHSPFFRARFAISWKLSVVALNSSSSQDLIPPGRRHRQRRNHRRFRRGKSRENRAKSAERRRQTFSGPPIISGLGVRLCRAVHRSMHLPAVGRDGFDSGFVGVGVPGGLALGRQRETRPSHLRQPQHFGLPSRAVLTQRWFDARAVFPWGSSPHRQRTA